MIEVFLVGALVALFVAFWNMRRAYIIERDTNELLRMMLQEQQRYIEARNSARWN